MKLTRVVVAMSGKIAKWLKLSADEFVEKT